MAAPGIASLASDHLRDMFGALRGEMRGLVGDPPGQHTRSNQEKSALWRKYSALADESPEEARQFIRDAAERAGHRADEEPPCEVCDFVMTYGMKEPK